MPKKKQPKKWPVAVAMADRRKQKLSPERRSEIARKAALARWGRKRS
jgi:hypothetical protein